VSLKPRGQVSLSHVLTGAATALLVGAGGVIWGLVKPEPKESEARAVDYALLKADVTTLKTDVATLKAQGTRIEAAIIRLETTGGVRAASGKH
jgi:hypothetical protein